MSISERKKAYNSDILYGEINEFMLDYLKDNISADINNIVQKKHEIAIIDEIDTILQKQEPVFLYKKSFNNEYSYLKANAFVRRLKGKTQKNNTKITNYSNYDYIVNLDTNNIELTPKGILKLEENYEIKNYSTKENSDILFFVNNALIAHNLMKKDIDYKIENEKIEILCKTTNNKIKQALEAKEHIALSPEDSMIAKISCFNYLTLYKKTYKIEIKNNKCKTKILKLENNIINSKISKIYIKRKRILAKNNVKQEVLTLIDSLCKETVNNYYSNKQLTSTQLALLQRFKMLEKKNLSKLDFENTLKKLVHAQYEKTEEIISEKKLRIMEKTCIIKQIDEKLSKYQQKAENINYSKYTENSYKREINKIFNEFKLDIKENVAKELLFAKK